MPTAPSPSLYPVPRAEAAPVTFATRLWYGAILLFILHLLLVAAMQWMIYRQFLERSLVDVREPLTDAFLRHGWRSVSVEMILLAVARLTIVGVRRLRPMYVDARMLTAAGLLAYAPMVLFDASVLVAFVAGWQLDVWLLPAGDASDREIASTIREALPIVLEPLTLARQAANVAGAILFAWLQHRLCRIDAGRATLHATLAGAAMVSGYWYFWGA